MKKNKKALLALAFTLTLCLGAVIGAAAASGLQAVTAYLNPGVSIKYEGEVKNLYDGNGARIYPITYNGSTYVPVRGISSILGVDVEWDSATKTVLLGESSSGVDLIDTYKPYSADTTYGTSYYNYQTADNKGMDISGVPVSHYIKMNHIGQIAGKNGKVSAGYYNIGGKYSTLTFQVYATADAVLQLCGDEDVLLGEFSLNGEQIAQTFTVSLEKTSQLCIRLGVTGVTSEVYVFNAVLS